jgi:nucleoside-diphosphate-sugar epimerase
MNVLLTGGYGCIGSWITRNLLQRGDRVWIYDLKEDPKRMRLITDDAQLRQVAFVQGDVTHLPRLREVLEKNQITHIVHLAGLQVPVCRADPLLGAKVNVLGTLAVLEAVRQLQGQIQRLVYTSSAAVFGPPELYSKLPAPPGRGSGPVLPSPSGRGFGSQGPLADDVPLIPSTHYGVFKCCNEGNARIYFQDFNISSVGLRPWTVFGVGRDFGMTSEPTKAIKSLALNRAYHISYGGVQDMQYVDDVAKITVRCLEATYQGAKSYNLRGHVVDMPALHRAMCEVDPAAAKLITFGERQIAIAYDLDDRALQRDLGPMPRTPLKEGIRQTLEMFRKLQAEGRLDTADLDAK